MDCGPGWISRLRTAGRSKHGDSVPKSKKVFDAFRFFNVSALSEAEKQPPEFLVGGMVPCGVTFLSGAPKTRKTFLALQMAADVASGKEFLDCPTTQCDVAYLDLEGSKYRAAARAEKMSFPMPDNVYITNDVPAKLADSLVERLRELHHERPTIWLIIIDTYSRARGRVNSYGANAYDADVALLGPVQRMAIEEKIAVLFVHHDKKGAYMAGDPFERLSGTMGISGSADCVINLVGQGKRFEGKATLEYTPRDAKGGEKCIVFDELHGEWQVVESARNLCNNPVCKWIIAHTPEPQKEGVFYAYSDIYREVYGHACDIRAGNELREQVEPWLNDLFVSHCIGLQLGAKS